MKRQHVFLGHASEDKPEVRALYQQLKARGLSPWLDAVDLMPGQNWRIEIPNAIKDAGVFLACLSKQSVAKQSYVQREFRYALSAYADRPPDSIFMIPVRLDECEVPDLRLPELELNLRDLHWVNLFEEDGFDRLAQAIEHALGKLPADQGDDITSEAQPDPVQPVAAAATPEVSTLATTVESETSVSAPPKAHSSSDVSDRSQTSTTPTASRSRNPAITAAWIGAAAVIVAGIFTSPWLLELLKTSDEPASIEPAAAPEEQASQADGARQPFESFRDCAQDVCPEMVMLPAGTFMMGSPPDEADRMKREGPQHEVVISESFAIGKTEVTFEEYDHFAEATGREKPDDRGWGRGQRPVINVSWDDANTYCAWLGEDYRLPTEAEWEYAARAGTSTRYSFGDDITKEQVNFGDDLGKTAEVGSFPENPWGLHDMHGNAWEWVSDWKGDYSSAAVTDPQGPATGTSRMVRGGSWFNDAGVVRSAYRSTYKPGGRGGHLGFRCVGV